MRRAHARDVEPVRPRPVRRSPRRPGRGWRRPRPAPRAMASMRSASSVSRSRKAAVSAARRRPPGPPRWRRGCRPHGRGSPAPCRRSPRCAFRRVASLQRLGSAAGVAPMRVHQRVEIEGGVVHAPDFAAMEQICKGGVGSDLATASAPSPTAACSVTYSAWGDGLLCYPSLQSRARAGRAGERRVPADEVRGAWP